MAAGLGSMAIGTPEHVRRLQDASLACVLRAKAFKRTRPPITLPQARIAMRDVKDTVRLMEPDSLHSWWLPSRYKARESWGPA